MDDFHLSPLQIVGLCAIFIGQAVASYVIALRRGEARGHSKAILEGAPQMFGESFLRRAESHFKASLDHDRMLTTHELKISMIDSSIKKLEAQFLLAQGTVMVELKELRGVADRIREDVAKNREDIAALRGALGIGRRQAHEKGDT